MQAITRHGHCEQCTMGSTQVGALAHGEKGSILNAGMRLAVSEQSINPHRLIANNLYAIELKMNKDQIFQLIAGHAREVVPHLETHEFQAHDQLSALGANSLDRADIVIMTLESLGLQIPLTSLVQVKNLGELADFLYEKKQAQ